MFGVSGSFRILIEEPSETAPKQIFTQEDFIRRLKNQETWTLKNFEIEDCRVCFGKGYISEFKGGGPCWECTRGGEVGKGYIDYQVRW